MIRFDQTELATSLNKSSELMDFNAEEALDSSSARSNRFYSIRFVLNSGVSL